MDKFSDVLVVESLALGIDRLKSTILSLVKKVLAEDGIMIRGIYERSDATVSYTHLDVYKRQGHCEGQTVAGFYFFDDWSNIAQIQRIRKKLLTVRDIRKL